MDMKPKKSAQEKLKTELELLTKKKFSNSEAWEAYHNLSGFFRVLKQMRKEANSVQAV